MGLRPPFQAVGWAAQNHHIDVLHTLLEAGADIEGRNRNGRSPLWIGKRSEHRAIACMRPTLPTCCIVALRWPATLITPILPTLMFGCPSSEPKRFPGCRTDAAAARRQH